MKDVSTLLNSESEKICHVVGHGPSLEKYLNKLHNLNKIENIIISLNDVDIFTGLNTDYWLTTNPQYSIKEMYNRINKFPNIKFIYSDLIDQTEEEIVSKLLKVDYFTFDFLHFESTPNSFFVKGMEFGCSKAWINCCAKIKNRMTIQESLKLISGFEHHYSTGDTNILHCLSLAIILGCKEINLYGVDLDYSKGYVNKHQTNENGASHGDSFDFWMDRLKSDFYIINESAKLLNVKIIYFGDSQALKNIFDFNIKPEKVYPSNCKNYE